MRTDKEGRPDDRQGADGTGPGGSRMVAAADGGTGRGCGGRRPRPGAEWPRQPWAPPWPGRRPPPACGGCPPCWGLSWAGRRSLASCCPLVLPFARLSRPRGGPGGPWPRPWARPQAGGPAWPPWPPVPGRSSPRPCCLGSAWRPPRPWPGAPAPRLGWPPPVPAWRRRRCALASRASMTGDLLAAGATGAAELAAALVLVPAAGLAGLRPAALSQGQVVPSWPWPG